jgi:hypothetical protein
MRYRRNPRKYLLRILLKEDGGVTEIQVIAYTVREVIKALGEYEEEDGFLAAFLEVKD